MSGDFSHEFSLGYLYLTPGPDRAPVYGCLFNSADYFLSLQSDCEGQLYSASRAGRRSRALPSRRGREARYPYALGVSKVVRVRVR